MFKKHPLGFYQLEKFLLPALKHGFSTKSFGNMAYKFGDKATVDQSRINFAKAVPINHQQTVQLSLNHGTTVAIAAGGDIGPLTDLGRAISETDAVLTNRRGVALWMMTGDCAPFIFFDPTQSVIGIAHAGWRGTIGKIAVMTVGKMVAEFGSRPKDILIGIGPTVEKCCYSDNVDPIQAQLPEWQNYAVKNPDGKHSVDLNGFSIHALLEIGIQEDNVDFANYCTQDHSDEFFCSQEETAQIAKPGRFATTIQIQ